MSNDFRTPGKSSADVLSPASGGREEKRARVEKTTSEVKATILTRINEALDGDILASGESNDKETETARVLRSILPSLFSTIATAISVGVEEVMQRMLEREDERPRPDTKLYSCIRQLKYENDRLQQYSRRESVRVFGITQEPTESSDQVEEKTLAVLRETGVSVVKEDVAACHRVGRPSSGPRPIIVRFVSRRKRQELMKNKRKLRDKEKCKKIFINDDLTPLRSRLLKYVKGLETVEEAWTYEGKIICCKKVPIGLPSEQRPPNVTVESPDDLFKLGVSSIDYSRLGLTHIAFDEEE